MTEFQDFVTVQWHFNTGQSKRYCRMPESVVTQEFGRFPLVPSDQPFPERWMEEHVRIVQAFYEKTREHLIKKEMTRCEII